MFSNINNVLYKKSTDYNDDPKNSKYMLQRWVSMYDEKNSSILNRHLNPNYAHLTDEEFYRLMFISTPRKNFKKIKYIKKAGKVKKNKTKSDDIDLGAIFEDSTVKIQKLIDEVQME